MKPIESYSLEDLATVLRAYGLDSTPDITVSKKYHFYFRHFTTGNNILKIFEEDTDAYFQIVKKPTSERRVAFIFENHFCKMAFVICYQGLKFDQWQKSPLLSHSLTKADPNNAYQNVIIYTIAENEKNAADLRDLLNGLCCQCIYDILDKPNSILLAESIQSLLLQDICRYQTIRHHIIAKNIMLMRAAHQLQCLQQVAQMLDNIKPIDRETVVDLLEILIKYKQLKIVRNQEQQKLIGSAGLLIDQQLQKSCFAQSFAHVQVILAILHDENYYSELLSIARTLQLFGATQLIDELTEKNIKSRNEITHESKLMRQATPPPSIADNVAAAVIYCFNNSYASLSGRLAVFFLQQLHSWIAFTFDYVCSKKNYTHFYRFLVLLLLQQLQSWTAPKSAPRLYQVALLGGIAAGFWFMYTLGLMVFLISNSLVFLAERLHQNLKEERLDLANASWSSKEDLAPSFSTVLKILLFLFSFLSSIIFDNSIYMQNMALSLMTSWALQLFFTELVRGISFASEQERNSFEFLFIQLCSLCVEEVSMRYTEREAIIARYAPQPANSEVKISWDWWFFRKKFDLTHYNETHVSNMRCEITHAKSETMSCVVQQISPWVPPALRS